MKLLASVAASVVEVFPRQEGDVAAIRERTVHSLDVVALYNDLLCQRNGRCRRIGFPLVIWSGISPTYSILHDLRCAGNEALLGVLFSLIIHGFSENFT